MAQKEIINNNSDIMLVENYKGVQILKLEDENRVEITFKHCGKVYGKAIPLINYSIEEEKLLVDSCKRMVDKILTI